MFYSKINNQKIYKELCNPSPFLMDLLSPILSKFSYEMSIQLFGFIFIIFDAINALLILFIIPNNFNRSIQSDFLSLLYFLHPYTILSCNALSTTIISFTFLFFAIACVNKNSILSIIAIPLLYLAYPPFLPCIFPLILLLNNNIYKLLSLVLMGLIPICYNSIVPYLLDTLVFNCIKYDYTISLSLYWQLFLQSYEQYHIYYQWFVIALYYGIPTLYTVLLMYNYFIFLGNINIQHLLYH